MAHQIYWNSELYHYGKPRRSGRYPWGSGKDPYHHGASVPRRLISKYDKLEKKLQTNKERTSSAFATSGARRRLEKRNKLVEQLDKTEVGSKERSKLYDKVFPLDKKVERDTAKELAKYEKAQQRIVDKMNKIDDKLKKKYMDDVDPEDLKRGKQYLDNLDKMAYAMSRSMEVDYPTARKIAKELETNDVVYYTDGKKKLSVVEKDPAETYTKRQGFELDRETFKKFNEVQAVTKARSSDGREVELMVEAHDSTKPPSEQSLMRVNKQVKNNIKTLESTSRKEIIKQMKPWYEGEWTDKPINPKWLKLNSISTRLDKNGRPDKTDIYFDNTYDGHCPNIDYDHKKKKYGDLSYDG